MRLAFVALAGLCLVAMAAPARANIVQNPGFETGDFTSWTQTGWGINGSVPAHTGNFDASTGCVGAPCVDPTNPNAASLSQGLATVAGTSYNLSFWFEGVGPPDELKVFWGGNLVLDLVNDQIVSNPSAAGETEYTVNGLLAGSTTTSLTFLGRQDPAYDALDDVDVEVATIGPAPVSEPTSLALFGAALVGFGWIRRRAS